MNDDGANGGASTEAVALHKARMKGVFVGRWQVLAAGGSLGVATLWLAPFEVLLPEVRITTGLRLLSLVQPLVLTLAAVFVGHYLAPKVGLGAPLIDALLAKAGVTAVFRRIVPAAIFAGLVSALVIVAFGVFVTPELVRASSLGARLGTFELPLLTKLLYGGIAEEILTRWGLMSLFAWIGWRIKRRPERPRNSIFWIAIAASAVLFAGGHLPMLMLVSPDPKPWMIAAVLLGNAIPGVIFGWLFWRKGIEAAILAHMLAHLISSIIT